MYIQTTMIGAQRLIQSKLIAKSDLQPINEIQD